MSSIAFFVGVIVGAVIGFAVSMQRGKKMYSDILREYLKLKKMVE